MNKDQAKEFMDRAINADTVAIMVIRKYDNPGEFRAVMMDESSKYHLYQAFMDGSVLDFLNATNWNAKETEVPNGMSKLEFQVWLALQPLQPLRNEVPQSTIP